MSSANQWYVIVEGEEGRRQEGPVSGKDLEAMLSSGSISTETLVWHDGMADWVPLGAVTDLTTPPPQDALPEEQDLLQAEPAPLVQPEAATDDDGPLDLVPIRDIGNHSIRLSRSRSVLSIVANEQPAGPLELTKLDLLGFLTTMEESAREG